MIIDGHIDQQGNSSDGEEEDDVEDDADAAAWGEWACGFCGCDL